MKDLKQKVFGLYINQPIAMTVGWPHFDTDTDFKPLSVTIDKADSDYYLRVTPLHLITDEHKLALYVMGWTYNKKGLQIAPIEEWKAFTPEQIDFLRSNSYATPCFGKEVSELVTMGIFKLKEA